MRIAVLARGSLIRCPGGLTLASKWHRDGPDLTLELSRKSSGEHPTFVIDEKADAQPTFWALSSCYSLDEAREELRKREGIRENSVDRIHAIDETGMFVGDSPSSPAIAPIKKWVNDRDDIDAAIWTGRPVNWPPEEEACFGPWNTGVAIAFLRCLEYHG